MAAAVSATVASTARVSVVPLSSYAGAVASRARTNVAAPRASTLSSAPKVRTVAAPPATAAAASRGHPSSRPHTDATDGSVPSRSRPAPTSTSQSTSATHTNPATATGSGARRATTAAMAPTTSTAARARPASWPQSPATRPAERAIEPTTDASSPDVKPPAGLRRNATADPTPAPARRSPTTTANVAVLGVPSQPASRAPTTSSVASPRVTAPSASVAPRSARRADQAVRPADTAVSTTSVAVRPPIPICDQLTARKTRAATSRQSAPSVSRIFGTDAAERVALADGAVNGVTAGPAAGVAGAGAWTPVRSRSRASSTSARLRVVKSSCPTGPVRSRRQDGQTARAVGRVAPQSGQWCGSAKSLMHPSSHGSVSASSGTGLKACEHPYSGGLVPGRNTVVPGGEAASGSQP